MQVSSGVVPPVAPIVIRQAEKIRLEGDKYFIKDRIGAAIEAFTEAIVLDPGVSLSYLNRAYCFSKKRNWARVEEDCKKAIELDRSCYKGYHLLGLALIERKEYAEGIKQLEKAFDLAKGTNQDDRVMHDIWQNLGKAKYTNWEQESSKQSGKLSELKEICEKALKEYFLKHRSSDAGGDVVEAEGNKTQQQLDHLFKVFKEIENKNNQTEVPGYLCCIITLEIFRDPVITPYGITYERSMLLKHLREVGPFDPTTRQPLRPHQLIPNLAIREAVITFLSENGWAYETVGSSSEALE